MSYLGPDAPEGETEEHTRLEQYTLKEGETLADAVKKYLPKATRPELMTGCLLLQEANLRKIPNVHKVTANMIVDIPQNFSAEIQNKLKDPSYFPKVRRELLLQYKGLRKQELPTPVSREYAEYTLRAGETLTEVIKHFDSHADLPKIMAGAMLLQAANLDTIQNVHKVPAGLTMTIPPDFASKITDLLKNKSAMKKIKEDFMKQFRESIGGKAASKPRAPEKVDPLRITEEDRAVIQGINRTLETFLKEKKGPAALVTFEEISAALSEDEQNFLNRFLSDTPAKVGKAETPALEDTPLKNPTYVRGHPDKPLPKEAKKAFEKMAAACKEATGQALLISSAYRTEAYQLVIFLKYLERYKFKLTRTLREVAFPGYGSEHNDPYRVALDLATAGHGRKNFEKSPAYPWLQEHADEYHFSLSYPEDGASGVAFEPWHWRYDPPKLLKIAKTTERKEKI